MIITAVCTLLLPNLSMDPFNFIQRMKTVLNWVGCENWFVINTIPTGKRLSQHFLKAGSEYYIHCCQHWKHIIENNKDSMASQIDWLRKIMIFCLDLMLACFCSLCLICKKFFFLLFCRKYSGKIFLSLPPSLPKIMLAHIVQTYSLSVFPMLDNPVPLVQKCWSC